MKNSKLVCETPSAPASSATSNPGNRGFNLIKENRLITFNGLSTAAPSPSTNIEYIEQAFYQDLGSTDVTVWMQGFIVPSKTSDYELNVDTNGYAVLFISTDDTPINKVNLA
jgi:hypothetical protein